MPDPVKVLILDDSSIIRQVMTEELGKIAGILVVGSAPDPYVGRDKIVELNPDVLVLDVEMPRMDGITFLKKLMHYRPMPVIIVSSLTSKGGKLAMEALSAGALAVMSKPQGAYTVADMIRELAAHIIAVSGVKMGPAKSVLPGEAAKRLNLPQPPRHVIAIGASTGGTQAIQEILTRFPRNAPGTLIVQHMPAHFTTSFAQRLDELCEVEVREAKEGDVVGPGLVLIAPGSFHMVMKKHDMRYSVGIKEGLPVCGQRPSVNVLFKSVARCAEDKAIGVLLTGMGADGAEGMLEMKQAGAHTVAQDEASSVVWGMPGEAVKRGAACKVLPLSRIADYLLTYKQGE